MHLTSSREQLMAAREYLRQQSPVWIARVDALEADPLLGIIVSVSTRWCVIRALVDAVYSDGLEVVRTADIAGIEPASGSGLLDRSRGEVPLPSINLDLKERDTVRDLIERAAAISPIITLHSEKNSDGMMVLGRILKAANHGFEMRLMDPDGHWIPSVAKWKYEDVTRISVGDRYANALYRFGDTEPS